jgi:hypothetical protein
MAAPALNEAFSISSQVGFAASACRSARLGSPEFAHETVLAHYLSTGPLWETIRVKAGAYGASCSTDGLEGVLGFSSYRDPRPLDSIAFFPAALEAAASGMGEEEAEEAAVGATGRDLKPLLPEEKGLADFKRELYGVDDELRRSKRAALLAVRAEDIMRAARRLAAAMKDASSVLISHAEDVQFAGRALKGARVTELPL